MVMIGCYNAFGVSRAAGLVFIGPILAGELVARPADCELLIGLARVAFDGLDQLGVPVAPAAGSDGQHSGLNLAPIEPVDRQNATRVDVLHRLGRGHRHSQPLDPAFDDVDGEDDVPALGCPPLARFRPQGISRLRWRQRAERLEHSILHT
jgi:hypothetical protein